MEVEDGTEAEAPRVVTGKRLPTVPTAQDIIDKAFSRASRAPRNVSAKSKRTEVMIKELKRIETATDVMVSKLEKTRKQMPHPRDMTPFERELLALSTSLDEYRKSLAALEWARSRIIQLQREHKEKIKKAKSVEMAEIRRAFYGRAASILKQISRNLDFLRDARERLRELPSLRDLPTVVIAGAPNVGKSSLLRALTGSEPEVRPYPFTTQSLMVGYIDRAIQLVDTPGILDRSLEERNEIEKKAILALVHLPRIVLFVFDPTLSCGYSLEEQKKLYTEITSLSNAPAIVAITKKDMPGHEEERRGLEQWLSSLSKEKRPVAVIHTSVETGEGIRELEKKIYDLLYPSRRKPASKRTEMLEREGSP